MNPLVVVVVLVMSFAEVDEPLLTLPEHGKLTES